MRKPSDLTGALVLAAALVLPGLARAQDGPTVEESGPPFRPSNDQLDEELDETLQQEYDEDHPAPPPPEPAPPPPPPEDRFELRLGGLAAHYYAIVRDVEVFHRDHGSGGEDIELDERDAVADFDPRHLQHYRMWIDLGKHVSFEGGFRRGVFRGEQPVARDAFTFGQTTFQRNENVETTIDTLTADLDLVVKPVNNRFVELGLHLGSRYMFWRTELKSTASALRRETSTLEAAVPVVGASLALRPVRPLELFVRGRVGYLEYDRPESTHYSNGRLRHIEAKDKEAKTCELDAGIMVTIDQTIGVIAGYRLDYLRIEREVDNRAEGARGTVHGIYAGLILEF